MANDFDSAVGAVLEIPKEALAKIDAADKKIRELAKTSQEAADSIARSFSVTAVGGLDKFIKKITDTQTKLQELGGGNIQFNINTTVAQQNLESLSSQTKKTTTDVSANLQKLSYTDIDFGNLRASLEDLKANFGQVEALIKSLQTTRKVQILEGDPQEQVQQLTNMMQKLKEYLDVRKKSSEQIEAAEKKQAEAIQKRLEAEQKALQRKADTDRNAAEQLLNNLYAQRLNILSRIEAQNTKVAAEQRGLTNAETQMSALLASQLSKIDTEISNIAQKYPQLAQAARVAFNTDYAKAMADENIRLEQALNKSADAQRRLKESNIKSLLSEYKQLTKEAESLARSMSSFRDSGGKIADPKYQAIERQWIAVIDRMNAIERQQIAEINQFRTQQYIQSLQSDLSAFAQNEAEKKAIAKQRAEEQAQMMIEAQRRSYVYAMASYNQLMTGSGKSRDKLKDTYADREVVIKRLETAIKNLNKADSDYEAKLNRLTSALNKLKEAQKGVNDVLKQRTSPTIASAQQAVATARATKSLEDYKRAHEELKAVMSTMDSSSVAFKIMSKDAKEMKTKIDQIKRSMGEFQSQTKRTGDLMDNLKGKIAAAFSIAAISGFIRKVVETRAQFELQRIALGAIIQDTDKANKTFLQIQQMALQSPFSIMQLERATKQIAAFGFEADKLLPTMKMLGDISAGLGVEIDRLILVMGHLKARNYLEGTMVRQFTNAGFNVLGELAKYYSELEGKMVSVAEVQTRVKKKMVEFGDVEEVLKRVTAAGGMFYDMQKKQSDSLWGQMQRITDAYDLMLNEIGKDNQNMISQALTAVRSLIQHWRILAPTIKAVGYTMAAVFAARGIGALLVGLTKFHALLVKIPVLLKTITTGIRTMNVAWATTGVGALVAGVSILASMIAGAYAEAKALNGEINHIQEEGETKMFTLIYKYRELADAVSSSTKSYAEKEEALKELKRTYKDILPAEMLQIDNIKKMTDGYNAATDAIREYMNEQMRVNAREAVDKETRTAYSEWQNRLAKRFAKGLIDWNNIDTNESEMKGRIKAITDQIYQEIMNGNLKAEDGLRRFRDLFQQYYGLEDLPNVTNAFASMWESKWWDIAQIGKDSFQNIFEDYSDFMDEVESRFDESLSLAERIQMQMAKPQRDQYAALTKAMEDYARKLRDVKANDVYNTPSKDRTEQQKQSLKDLDEQLKAVNALRKSLGLMPITYAEIRKSLESNMEVEKSLREQTLETYRAQLDQIEKIARAANNNALLGWIDTIRNKLDETDLSKEQKAIQQIIDDVEDLNNINLGDFRWAIIDSSTTVAEARNNVKKELDALKENVKEYNASTAKQIFGPIAAMLFFNGKTLEEVNAQINALDLLWQRLGGHEKDKKSGKDPILEQWKNRLDALKRYYDAAEKARKHLNEQETSVDQRASFEKLWSDLGLDKLKGLSLTELLAQGFDPKKLQTDYVEAMKQLLEYVPKKYEELRTKIQEQISSESIEIKFKVKEDEEEQLKRQLDNMFDSYELTKQLKDIGLNIDLTYMVGGRPTTLQDIRDEIARLREEGGGTADAENRIKILEDAEKKITDIEVKEQKQRLKNYEKYLKSMYSERAQKMIESYTTMELMERDFQKNIQQLEQEMMADGTTDARKKELSELIKTLKNQAKEAGVGIQRELSQALSKADWESFKGSEIFVAMYQDLETLSKKGIDALIKRLEMVRNQLQSMENVDPKAVREVTQYIEKLRNTKIELAPFQGFNTALQAAKDLKKEYGSIEKAQLRLIELNDQSLGYEQQVADLETIIDLQNKKIDINTLEGDNAVRLNALYEENKDDLQEALNIARQNLNSTQSEASALGEQVEEAKKLGKAYQAQMNRMQKYREYVESITNSIFDMADALGASVDDEWKALASSILNAVFQAIALQLQMQLLGVQAQILGVEMNSALGIIGWVATALQVVANLLMAVFAAHDKRLQKQIEKLQDEVEVLDKAFQKLQKSIERAFTTRSENNLTQQAIDNLNRQKDAYNEMIRLEESKKKKDNEKIKEYKEKLEELNDSLVELYETRHEKWGSTNDAWGEANNWVDAWLDAFKETGDGLDSLNESWDAFYENLVKKQAVSKVLGSRMDEWINGINKIIDSNMSEYRMVDAFKQLGEKFRSEFGNANELLKKFFEYAGIGGNGEYLLSDLQKGIQNITEPQAAAIEAYLNSIRFEVFRRGEQIDSLIATIQSQYGVGESPMLQEVRTIRSILTDIRDSLNNVIVYRNNANTNYAVRVI